MVGRPQGPLLMLKEVRAEAQVQIRGSLRAKYDSCLLPAHALSESYSRQLRIQMSVTEH
jgi:hypothetical protein